MSDTIVAISTALGEGGIGIVRLSGPACLDIMRNVSKEFALSKANSPRDIVPRYAYYGHVVDINSQIIDEAVFLYMKAPASYTGEDMLEIQAHGSNVALRRIVRACLDAGRKLAKDDERINVRIAEPGEFTKLAFLNGKMDLSQAEAVVDIINSRTDFALGIAERQRQGRLSDAIGSFRNELKNLLAQMAVNIDYPDEDIEEESYEEYIDKLRFILDSLDRLAATSEFGKLAKEGIHIAIVGKPNVGKSSLMNALLGEGRAIVTDIPGTTRDTLEETASINGIPIVIIDTAGIHETNDVVEKIGIERTREAINLAQVAVIVIDGSEDIDEEDLEVIRQVKSSGKNNNIVVINKEDKGIKVDEGKIIKYLPNCTIIKTSLIGFSALDAAQKLGDSMKSMFKTLRSDSAEGNIITNQRHIEALLDAHDNLETAMYMLEENEPLEIVELNVHYAYDDLGYIIGEAVGDEILDTVFSKFCLGK